MATTSFAYCERTVLAFEGGKVVHPNDPGGRTNQGVIQRAYDGWRWRKGPAQAIKWLQRAAMVWLLRQLGIEF
jgi:lysozyme family protein